MSARNTSQVNTAPAYTTGAPTYSTGVPTYSTGVPTYTTGVPTYGAPVYGGAYTTSAPVYSAGLPSYTTAAPVYGGAYTTGAPVYGGAYTTAAPVYGGAYTTGAPVVYGGAYTTGAPVVTTPAYTTGAPVVSSVIGGQALPQTRDLVHLNSRLDDILARTKTQGSYVASPNRIKTESALRNSATLRHSIAGPLYTAEPLRKSVVAPTASILRTDSPTLRRSMIDSRPKTVTFAASPVRTTGAYQSVVSPLRTTAATDLGYSQVARHVEPTFTYSKVVEPGVVTERQVVEPPVYTTTRHVEEGVETRTILEPSYETRTIVEPTYTTQRIVEEGVATQKVYEPYQVTSTRLVGENLVGGITTVGQSVRELETPAVPAVGVSAVSGYNYRPYETVKSSVAVVSPTRRYGSTATVASPLRTTNLAQSYIPTTGYATAGYATAGYATTGYATTPYTTNLASSYVLPSTGYVSGGYASTVGAPYSTVAAPYSTVGAPYSTVGGYTTVGAPYTTVGASPLVYGAGPYASQTIGGGYVDAGRTVRAANVGRLENDVESMTFDDDKDQRSKKAAPTASKP